MTEVSQSVIQDYQKHTKLLWCYEDEELIRWVIVSQLIHHNMRKTTWFQFCLNYYFTDLWNEIE